MSPTGTGRQMELLGREPIARQQRLHRLQHKVIIGAETRYRSLNALGKLHIQEAAANSIVSLTTVCDGAREEPTGGDLLEHQYAAKP